MRRAGYIKAQPRFISCHQFVAMDGKRILPVFIVKGAAAMAEDRKCIEQHLCSIRSDRRNRPFDDEKDSFPVKRHCSRATSTQLLLQRPSANAQILDAAARHQVLNLVGNVFSSRSASIRSWPTIESHGNMLCGSHFKFDRLFDTYRAYLDPCAQVRATALLDPSLLSLDDVAAVIEKQVLPSLLIHSDVLQQQHASSSLSEVVRVDGGGRLMCWSISPVLHRVVVRTVLLQHLGREPAVVDGLSDGELCTLVRNLQDVIVNMQVATCGNVNVIFHQPVESQEISMFLEGNEEVLEGDVLHILCSQPRFKMNVGELRCAFPYDLICQTATLARTPGCARHLNVSDGCFLQAPLPGPWHSRLCQQCTRHAPTRQK